MADGQDRSSRIKVVDRRRFTDDGTLRDDSPPGRRAQAAGTDTLEAEERSSSTTSRAFMELVVTLARQAEDCLAGGSGLPVRPTEGRRILEYLGVLASKTRGNLSPEEAQVLTECLDRLHSLGQSAAP